MHFANKNTEGDKPSYLFLNQKYSLGGSEFNFNLFQPGFNGLRQSEFPINSIAKVAIEVQYNLFKNIYLSPSFNYAKTSHNLSPFKKGSENLYGFGANLGYESILGPINVNVSKNNAMDFWRVYFSMGYKF